MPRRFVGKSLGDHAADAFFVSHDILGSETQHGEASASQIVVAGRVVALRDLRMMGDAVNFDNQSGVKAHEIYDVAAELGLLAEMIAVGSERVEQTPHGHLGESRRGAEFPCEGPGCGAPLPSCATRLRLELRYPPREGEGGTG
jgi:hypothetical protein